MDENSFSPFHNGESKCAETSDIFRGERSLAAKERLAGKDNV